jgi:hypothetical protein
VPEIVWLVRQIVMFAAYFYLHLLLVVVMTAICFPDTFVRESE